MHFMQGIYKPRFPDKYTGRNRDNIQYRSSLELTYMRKLDDDPNVLAWESETIIIPYTDKATGQLHRYFPDMKVVRRDDDGKVRTYLIEIKPITQVHKPVKGNKNKTTYIREVMTYGRNLGKWESAERFCEKKGWFFKILTEKDLGRSVKNFSKRA